MKKYILALIVEQTFRIKTLKNLISNPLTSSYIGQLSERCNRLLDSQLSTLNDLKGKLANDSVDLRQIHRKVRGIIKDVSVVESFGISSLRFQTTEVDFLNGLAFQISNSIALPLTPPAVSCLSTDYFYFEPFTKVIYVPQAEPYFLLHIPDLYHEIGHYVLSESLDGYATEKLEAIATDLKDIFDNVTEYFNSLIKKTSLNEGPKEIPLILHQMHSNWKSWVHEFFCDLFAIYMLGPAYAWSHLHLVFKTRDNVYQGNWLYAVDHPADEARMRLLLKGLCKVGFKQQAEEIKSKWVQITKTSDLPDSYYTIAYPELLLDHLSEKFLATLQNSGFTIISPYEMGTSLNSIPLVLNNAWQFFWSLSPEDYRKWEKGQIELLKKNLHSHEKSS